MSFPRCSILIRLVKSVSPFAKLSENPFLELSKETNHSSKMVILSEVLINFPCSQEKSEIEIFYYHKRMQRKKEMNLGIMNLLRQTFLELLLNNMLPNHLRYYLQIFLEHLRAIIQRLFSFLFL